MSFLSGVVIPNPTIPTWWILAAMLSARPFFIWSSFTWSENDMNCPTMSEPAYDPNPLPMAATNLVLSIVLLADINSDFSNSFLAVICDVNSAMRIGT